jgi:hypothetical protein
VPVGDEGQGRVSMAVAALARGPDERFDLGEGQVLALAYFATGGAAGKLPAWSHCLGSIAPQRGREWP